MGSDQANCLYGRLDQAAASGLTLHANAELASLNLHRLYIARGQRSWKQPRY